MQSEVLRGPRAAHQTKDIPPCRYRPAGSPPSTDERSLPTGPLRQRSRATPDEGRNQWSSVVISGHQGRQRQRSRATPDEGRNQWSSVVIRRQIVRDPYLLPRALRRLSLRNRPRLQPRLRARSMQPSRARGRQKRVAAVGVSPVLGGSKQCMRREQPDEGGNQRSSVVIRSNACATSSLMREVIRGHQWSSEAMHAPRAA